MDLYDRIEKIMFDRGILLKDFLETIEMSKGTYYKIKDGRKKELSAVHVKNIRDNYSEYSYDWIMGKGEDPVSKNCGLEALILKADNLGVLLSRNHKYLMDNDETYKLFIEKMAYAEAIKITKGIVLESQSLEDSEN